jgi:hypothetical protein
MRYIIYIPFQNPMTLPIYFHDIPNDIPVVFPIGSPFWLFHLPSLRLPTDEDALGETGAAEE